MDNHIKIIEETLLNELQGKGINDEAIPRFIKDLAYSYEIDPSYSLSEINERLHYLGWDDIELDYHTLQLAIASIERDQSGDSASNKIH